MVAFAGETTVELQHELGMIQKEIVQGLSLPEQWSEPHASSGKSHATNESSCSLAGDWLRHRRWANKKNEISPLFWLLNSHTFNIKAAEQIESWHLRLKHQKTRKFKSSDRQGFQNRWDDLLEAVQLGTKLDSTPLEQVAQSLLSLGAAYLLPKVVKREGKKHCFAILSSLVPCACQRHLHDSRSMVQPWLEQLAAVELPLQLSSHFPDFVVEENIGEVSAAWMSDAIHQYLDRTGCPSAELLPIFGPMVASWVRAGELLEKLKCSLKPSTMELLSSAVLHVFRILRNDRQLMFSDPQSAPLTDSGLKRMIKQFGNGVPRRLLHRLQDRPDSILAQPAKPAPGSPSAWGSSAILRANWEPHSAHAVLAFAGLSCQCEIGAHQTLISGAANPSIRFEGQPVAAIEGFRVTCEEFDRDVNYVELVMPLADSVELTRQWLLARKEQILYIADSVNVPRAGLIEYSCDWPLTRGISVMPETETREIYLCNPAIQALVLPIGLSEWQVAPSSGRLSYQPDRHCFRLTEQVSGIGLHAPLVVDLCPKRSRQKRTWRQLTVAQSGRAVARDVAVAYRIQLGRQQWYTYRSLQTKTPRTFFGEHFKGEFVFGRFNRKGDMKEMLRIE